MGVGVDKSIGGRKVEQPGLPSGCDDGAAPWLEGNPSPHHSTLPDTSVEAYQQWVLQQQQQYVLWKQQQQQGFSQQQQYSGQQQHQPRSPIYQPPRPTEMYTGWSNNSGYLGGGNMPNQHGCCGSQEATLSKFDYRRFLPASERRKQLQINSTEELWQFHSKLLKDMIKCGDDVTGFVEHMDYISEMASSGIYKVEALVAYDEVMLERARNGGPEVFCGADTHLTNTKLGMAGTRAVRGQGNQGNQGNRRGRYNRSRGVNSNNTGRNYGSDGKNLTGWRKLASEKGVCFRFSQNMLCDGCAFKHQCLYCDNVSHCMFDCKSNSARSSDNKA